MAKNKKELLEEAKSLGIELDSKATVAQIQAAIKSHGTATAEVVPLEPDTTTEEPVDQTEPKPLAKAGKRSAKALEEVAEKHAKEERKTSGDRGEVKPKKAVQPARSRLERRSKGFRKSAEQFEKG